MQRFNRNKLKTDSNISLLFDYGIDVDNRRIWLLEDICDTEYEACAKALHLFNSDPDKKHKPVEVIVCSNGGVVELMFAFYDLFRSSESPIHTIITGTCASAAVLVAICGTKRYATENAHMMHHSSKAFSEDLSEKELESRAAVIKKFADRTYSLLALHSYESEAWWRKSAQQEGEIWLDAKEMLHAGIIDGIIPNPAFKKLRRSTKPRKKKVNAKQTPVKKTKGA